MLTKISVEIYNNPNKAGIELVSTLTGINATDIDSVVIKRQKVGSFSWDKIYEYSVDDVDDLEFDLLDILAVSGEKYNYSVDLMSDNGISNGIVESQVFSVEEKCEFEGLMIGNFETQYIAPLDWQVDYKRNTTVTYVNTLAGRTPYRVSNSENNYDTGSVSALFMPILDGKLSPEYDHTYQREIVDFLTDGTEKLIKTNDGQMWYASIDDAITVPFDERYKGRNIIEFNWTETGDIPPFGMVKL